MNRLLALLSLVCVTLLLATAGCVITDVDSEIPSDPVVTPPLLEGDAIVGVWKGVDKSTFEGSGTGQKKETTTSYTISVFEDGMATLSYIEREIVGFSSSTNKFTVDAPVSKAENVYTITSSLLGTYVITLLDDGTAELTTPKASVVELKKESL